MGVGNGVAAAVLALVLAGGLALLLGSRQEVRLPLKATAGLLRAGPSPVAMAFASLPELEPPVTLKADRVVISGATAPATDKTRSLPDKTQESYFPGAAGERALLMEREPLAWAAAAAAGKRITPDYPELPRAIPQAQPPPEREPDICRRHGGWRVDSGRHWHCQYAHRHRHRHG